MAFEDETVRIRLEGRVELLEASNESLGAERVALIDLAADTATGLGDFDFASHVLNSLARRAYSRASAAASLRPITSLTFLPRRAATERGDEQ